jgi:hypothetical protein
LPRLDQPATRFFGRIEQEVGAGILLKHAKIWGHIGPYWRVWYGVSGQRCLDIARIVVLENREEEIAEMSGTADYSYRPPGNYGGKPPTQEELRYAFENAPACHHDHGLIARQASQFLAAREAEGESDVSASA